MNQLPRIPAGRYAVGSVAAQRAASNVRPFVAAREDLRSAPVDALICHWRPDPTTGTLCGVWTVSHGSREPASPVPLRRSN